jgi:hypothetical protein
MTGKVKRAIETLDSDDLGLRRFFYATRVQGRTHFFTVWAEDGLDANRLMPDGEAPGADLPGLPRADGIVRTFSIGEVGKPYGLAVYTDAKRSPEELEAVYVEALRNQGWTLRPTDVEGKARAPIDLDPTRHAFVAARGESLAVVVARKSGDHTVLALALGSTAYRE